MKSEILAEVIRGETVESIHRGHLVVVDGAGAMVAAVGEPEMVTYWRSAAKAFQAIPFITSGAADHFNFTEKEIALACASHNGEEMHTETCGEMLEKCGLSESDLRCGSQIPFDNETAKRMIKRDEKATQIHNNCSGKHSAMLAFAKYINADLENYLSLENPIQQKILEMVSLFTEVPESEIKLGTDGCSAPNFAVSLKAMALAFAKLVNPPESFDENLKSACERIVSAMTNFPEMIGGTGRLDTDVMQALKGKVICKVGAEGVWSAAVLPSEKWTKGLGIAVKIEDGDDKRARPVVAVGLLRQLGVLGEDKLTELSPMPVKTRRGETVGEVKAVFEI